MTMITAPFFEIGPKNLLRRAQLEAIARSAGEAASEFDVTVILTVPTAFIAPVHDLGSHLLVFAQGMDPASLGDSMGVVTAEALVDAGASGVMLNHDSNPLEFDQLTATVARAHEVGLATIICAATESDARRFATMGPAAVLFEPPDLIGTSGGAARPWIAGSTAAIHRAQSGVLAMHAGGVATAEIADTIMTTGADGTGSTSGVLFAEDPLGASRDFIAATRAGWDRAHSS
jgi:triosephosphate isomerase